MMGRDGKSSEQYYLAVRRLGKKENTYHSLSSSTCGRQARIRRRARSAIEMEYGLKQCPKARPGWPATLPTSPGLRPASIQVVNGEYQQFRRVEFQEQAKPVRDFQDAMDRIGQDDTDATAISYIAFEVILALEENKQGPDEIALPISIMKECIEDMIYLGEQSFLRTAPPISTVTKLTSS
jgi:hypothetical protein